jgi:hypothetical protein
MSFSFLGGFSPLPGVSGLQVEVQEMIPRKDDPTVLIPGRSIRLTFCGLEKKLSLPFLPIGLSGESSWHPVKISGLVSLNDFEGPGSIHSGGVSFGSLGWSMLGVVFDRAGVNLNISDSPGLDCSLPGPTIGYWKRSDTIKAAFGNPKDEQRKNQLFDEEKKYVNPFFIAQRELNAARKLKAELEAERAALLARNDPTAVGRLQEIEMSIAMAQWIIDYKIASSKKYGLPPATP